jgi:hypothetical protein
MSLFGPSRPGGITKEELVFIRGELANAPFGHGDERLNDRQIDELIEELEMAMDPDNAQDMKNGWAQVNAVEATAIEANAANGKGLKYSAAQQAHIKTVFDKYLKIDKHKSSFSI